MVGIWLSQAGPLGAVLGFAGGCVVMSLIGATYSAMMSELPVAGGELAYSYKIYGLGVAFATGWALTLSYVSVVAFEVISLGWVWSALFDTKTSHVLYRLLGADITLESIIVGYAGLLLVGWFNFKGAKNATLFQDGVTFLLIIVSLLFVGLALVKGDIVNLTPMFAVEGTVSITWSVFGIAATTCYWLAGFDTIPQAMEEANVELRGKRLTTIVVISIIAAAAYLCLVILSTAMMAPISDIKTMNLPAADVFRSGSGSSLFVKVVLFAGLLGLISSWNAFLFAASRIVFALGRARLIPPILGTAHHRFGAPANAVVFVCIAGGLLGLLGRNGISPIVNAATSCYAFVFLLTCIGVIRLYQNKAAKNMGLSKFIVPVLGACGASLMLALSLWTPYRTALATNTIPPEWAIIVVWTIAGFVFWKLAEPYRNGLSSTDIENIIVCNTVDNNHQETIAE